ncbi:MAG TPA: transglycosylase SLT domain-containing protein, partial [Methylophilaceae bacterium]
MAYRKDFPGLLVSDASDFDQDAQNAPFGSDAGSQLLTWAQGNVAPWRGNIFNATGLSGNSVQNVASQMATPFRDAGNWLSPGLGNSIWPHGGDASTYPGTSTDTPYQIHNPLLDVPMQVVMPKILTDATQLNMPNVAPLPPLQDRQSQDFGDLKNAGSLNKGTYTPEEAARIIQLTNIGTNLSANPVKMADVDKNALIQAAIDKKINPKYILNAVAMESGGNPNAISSSGAIGLTQIVGKTAQHLKIRDRFDPNQNIQGAIDLA